MAKLVEVEATVSFLPRVLALKVMSPLKVALPATVNVESRVTAPVTFSVPATARFWTESVAVEASTLSRSVVPAAFWTLKNAPLESAEGATTNALPVAVVIVAGEAELS